MEPFMARTMIESLSKGLNPLTGCVLPPRDICANEEVQDALLEVLAHCSIESTEQYLARIKEENSLARKEKWAENLKRYPRSGKPWTANEEQELQRLSRQGVSIYKIASILQRGPKAIAARQERLQSKTVYRRKK